MKQHNAPRFAAPETSKASAAPSARSAAPPSSRSTPPAAAELLTAAEPAPSAASAPAPASSRSSLRALLSLLRGPDGDAPIVRVLSPGEREELREGEKVLIRWSSQDNVGVTAQRVQLSLDDGRSYEDISPDLPGGDTRFLWTVPAAVTRRARIKVVAFDDAGNRGFGSSAQPFSICERPPVRPTVRILAPTGLQTLRVGAAVTICWEAEHVNPDAVRCDLYVSINGQDYAPLARGLPGTTQRLRWSIPTTLLGQVRRARLRVVLRTGDQVLAEDNSAEPLTIAPPLSSARPPAPQVATPRVQPRPARQG